MTESAPIDAAADRFEAALDAAQSADRSLRRMLGELALADRLEEAAWAAARRVHADRLAACQAIGEAALAWVRLGGGLVLDEPVEDEAGPVPQQQAGQLEAVASTRVAESSAVAPAVASIPAPALGADTTPPRPRTSEVEAAPYQDEPTEDDPTDEAPPPAPVSPDRLAQLQGRFAAGGSFSEVPPVIVQTSMPHAIASRLGAPRRVTAVSAWLHDVALLRNEVADQRGWTRATGAARHELVSYLVARARYLQDEAMVASPPSDACDQLRQVFGALSSYQGAMGHRFVNGLARHQRPAAGTWWAEAGVWWRKLAGRAGIDPGPDTDHLMSAVHASLTGQIHPPTALDRVERAIQGGVASDDPALLALVEPHAHLFLQTGRLKTLRSVLKERARRGAGEGGGDDPAPDEPDEPGAEVAEALVAFTRGKRALMVGGDRSNAAVDQTLGALELAELRRESGKRLRRVEAMVAQVRSGSVDLVLFIRGFLSHKVTDLLVPACKSRPEVDVVWVDDGYGAASIVRALEGAADRGAGA